MASVSQDCRGRACPARGGRDGIGQGKPCPYRKRRAVGGQHGRHSRPYGGWFCRSIRFATRHRRADPPRLPADGPRAGRGAVVRDRRGRGGGLNGRAVRNFFARDRRAVAAGGGPVLLGEPRQPAHRRVPGRSGDRHRPGRDGGRRAAARRGGRRGGALHRQPAERHRAARCSSRRAGGWGRRSSPGGCSRTCYG